MKTLITSLLWLSMCNPALAQSNTLHCARYSDSLGGYTYSKINVANNTIVDHVLLPGFTVTPFVSSTVDTVQQHYFICNGIDIWTIDAVADTLIAHVNVALQQAPWERYVDIQYYYCDSSIYGAGCQSTYQYLYSVVYICDPGTGNVTYQCPLPAWAYDIGAQGSIDAGVDVYVLDSHWYGEQTLQEIIMPGAVLGNICSTLNLNAGERYFGQTFDCFNNRRVGLLFDSTTAEIGLATYMSQACSVTPITGITWTISGPPYLYSSACVDQVTHTYYFTTGVNVIQSVDLNTGMMIQTHTIGNDSLFGVESMTGCLCGIPTLINNSPENAAVSIDYNRVEQNILISVGTGEERANYDVILTDVLGREVKKVHCETSLLGISVSDLAAGVYACTVYSDNSLLASDKIIVDNN